MNDVYQVAIIGAGPAGSSAAITLARSGARVALLEAGQFPRQKVCGEFVSPESLALLRSLVPLPTCAEGMPISTARLFFGSSCTSAPIEPPASGIPRLTLDSDLWHAAAEAGAHCLDQSPVLRIEGNNPSTILLDRGHRLRAQCVVDATGRWSRLRAADRVLLATRGLRWIGVKAHYFEATPNPSVDLYFFDGGYCGVQPVGPAEINVCAMVRSDRARTLPEVLRLHPALLQRSLGWNPASEPVTTSPLIFGPRKPVTDSVFNVGDAAGFIDPFAGDGIALALQTGALAAQIIAAHLAGEYSLDDALFRYRREYLQRFEPIFRNTERIRRLLNLPRPLREISLNALRLRSVVAYMVRKTRGRADRAA